MTKRKEELIVPYFEGRPCWWAYDKRDEERPNIPFEETFYIMGFTRGCSSCKMLLRRTADYAINQDECAYPKIDYEVFMSDSTEIIRKMTNGTIKGTFEFCKKGQNYGIRLTDRKCCHGGKPKDCCDVPR